MRKKLLLAAAGLGVLALFSKEYPALVREYKIMRM